MSAQSTTPDTDQYGRWVNGISEPWWFDKTVPKQEIDRLTTRWTAIELENAKPTDDSLAGNYGTGGETHGSFLRWSPSAGFVLLHVNKCAAQVMGFSYGSVIASPTTLQLVPEGEFSNNSHHHGHGGIKANSFLVVKWRNVPYLTTERYIKEFLDSLAGLGKSNGNSDWDIPVYGKWGAQEVGSADDLPMAPDGYERFVKRPINLTITSVGSRIVKQLKVEYDTEPQYESRTPVIISGGRSEGVKPGMKFWVLDSQESDEVIVRKVAAHTSSGVVIRWVEEDATKHFSLWKDNDRYPLIQRGWKLSTSVHQLVEANRLELAN